MRFYAVVKVIVPLLLLQQVAGVKLDALQQRSQLLEKQVQSAAQNLQNVANQLARNGVYQVERAAKQVEIAQTVQTIAGNAFASNGLIDLNSIERLGLSSNIRQCYLLNKFSFGDAINTAKTTAMQCITEKFNEGKTIVDNAINDIRETAQNMSGAAQVLAECRQFTVTFPSAAGLVAKVTCLSQALLAMKSSASLLPINLSRRAVDANAAISTIQSDIMKCSLNILSTIIEQSMNAGQAIAKCISQSSSG